MRLNNRRAADPDNGMALLCFFVKIIPRNGDFLQNPGESKTSFPHIKIIFVFYFHSKYNYLLK